MQDASVGGLSVGHVPQGNRLISYACAGNPLHPTIVFVPGIFLTPQSYERLLVEISHGGFHVVSIPLVDKGKLGGREPKDFAANFWNRVDALYEAGVISSPLLALSGHSGGGWLVTAAAFYRPESVPALILLHASQGEDYDLAMKRPVKFVSDLASEVYSYTKQRKPLVDTATLLVTRWGEHRQIIDAMGEHQLNDHLIRLLEKGIRHAQVLHSDRDYLVTEVGIKAQADALRVEVDVMKGHHGACIVNPSQYSRKIVQRLRDDRALFDRVVGSGSLSHSI
jgi:pimeloyl-ACP methyl ester carboxylesterase